MAKKNNNSLIFIAVVVVLAGLLLNLSQWGKFKLAKTELVAEEQQLALAEMRLNAMKDLDSQKEKMEADAAMLGQLLPGTALENELLVDLQSGADLSDMKFVQIRFGDRVAKEGFTEMPLSVVFTGNYYKLLHFLEYLSVYERAVRVDELRLDISQDNKNEAMINIRASAFYAQ